MYCLMREKTVGGINYDWNVSGSYCDSIVKYCHEVEATTAFENGHFMSLKQNDTLLAGINYLHCDSTFLDMFNIRILTGTNGFLYNDNEVAINRKTAERIWPDKVPLGQKITLVGSQGGDFTVTAVVDGWDDHSCILFDLLHNNTYQKNHNPYAEYNIPFSPSFDHILRLSPHADVEKINARLDSLDLDRGNFSSPTTSKLKLIPLNRLRNTYYQSGMTVRLNYIYLFALASGLLILCGLLNYLTMFINRLFIRQREIALRTVFGATERDLIVQFLVEYGLVLAFALFLGLYIIIAGQDLFCKFADLPKEVEFVFREGFVYLLLVGGVSLLISLPVISFFRRQALHNSIQSQVGLFSYSNFRKLSVCLQMCISILFIFCTVVFQKQLYTLRNDDFGFERKNIATIRMLNTTEDEMESFANYLRQQPEVVKLIRRSHALFPYSYINTYIIHQSRNPEMKEKHLELGYIEDAGHELIDFYGLKLLKGRFLQEDDDPMAIVINESAVQKFNWKDPIGKTIELSPDEVLHVVGVIKDFKNWGPTRPADPTFICRESLSLSSKAPKKIIIFKYQGYEWKTLKNKYEEYAKQYEGGFIEIGNTEEHFETYLIDEKNLQKLLHITTSVCILIALFGVWSMIMLTCEQRRKEIAVRKVFGATTKDILDMFFLEYMSLQGVAALMAFPIGYACMKPWLEQYVVQTSIPWWIYVGIFMAVALLVALCVGWRVWKTAKAHPADEIAKGRG